MTDAPDWAYDEMDDGDCPNCGGEGFVAMCVEEWACVDPEGGCDQCMRRCDWCSPPKASQTRPDGPREGGSTSRRTASESNVLWRPQ